VDYNEQLKDDITKRVHERINARMQRRMERRQRYGHGAGGMVIGGLIVIIGLMILLDNMGIVRFHDVWRYWPVLLIVVGVAKILESVTPPGYIWGGVITLAGALLLLDNLDIVVFDFNLIWPLLLIAFGLSMLLRSIDRKRYLANATGAPGMPGSAGSGPIDASSGCNAFAVFGGSKRRINTPDFRGGEAVAVFGGVEFDLRGAGMTVDQAVIDVNIVCGGLEVRVPDNWTIINRAMTIFGGVEDKTMQSKVEPNAKTPQLVLTGSVIFGGISLRN
jgi:cell wall-active antibiotic response 4TMS protein YvqF